ncbi:cadherin-related family member 5-like isoform X1 [Phyllopteryx taeniolatus]|uniref:cadherin-related family member 5-like isoform X1 n=2 Tax=Phyllopteryx taeniolatus TaxID=161469 RepID=UPI002AD43968|nr:cadherin-related family member 5-like isoform X1 [Phyllopteryx taeniolatus]
MVASRNFFFFLLALLLVMVTSGEAQEICSARPTVYVKENNAVGHLVETIVMKDGVVPSLEPSADLPFTLEGNRLLASRVLDYETSINYVVKVTCRTPLLQYVLIIVVLVLDENDNAPVFDANPYQIKVKELLPVGTGLDQFPATDPDKDATLYYRLTSASSYFRLASPENPQLVIQNILDYDKVQSVQLVLYVQDTPLSGSGSEVSFNTSTTIQVTVVDVDNRPPWFKPCIKHEVGGAVICQSNGYTSRVTLNELQDGYLTLKPNPLYAFDGDTGINEAIIYSFLSGNEAGLFDINRNTGNISMLRAADVFETIVLTVLAAQTPSSFQFATTSLMVSVQVKSLHKPQFQRPQYQGVVSSVGAMATDPTNKDEPLQIVALDEDYASMGGINPHIVYRVMGSEDFSIINGFLFMTTDLPEATLSLRMEAEDTSNEEKATVQLSVEVKSGLTTTGLPLSTTESVTSLPTTDSGTTDQAESTTNPSTTNLGTSTEGRTTKPTESTTNPGTPTDSSVSTGVTATSELVTYTTTESPVTSLVTNDTGPTSTVNPHTDKVPIPAGGFGAGDMAALGATLGVLLFICMVVIGVLVCHLQRGKADSRKIHEASLFRSSLGQGSGGEKQGVQYTNEAFQHDDSDSVGSGGPYATTAEEGPANDLALKSSVMALGTLLDDDNVSQTSSDKEKEVKPILTKERRLEEGYKAVWFKEDIDPDAKEEVVIIPDSREDNSEDEDDNGPAKGSKVGFAEADLDSGLGVKMEDLAEDSDVLDVDL